MSAYYTPLQMRASSSAFQWGSLVHTTWKTGCLRKILIQSKGYESAIDPKYTLLGKINEDRHEARLIRLDQRYEKEVEFLRAHADGKTTWSGHADFILLDAKGARQSIDELKSVSSKNVYRTIIKQGNYNVENLAQLVAYMMEARLDDGRLIYTYYELDEQKQYEAIDERTFLVHIDDYGRISVDASPTQFTLYDVIAHQYAAADVILNSKMAERPYRGEVPFVGCCNYCPFSSACAKYDSGELEGSEAFINNVLKGDAK